jgi:hypothetical protein
MGQNLGFQMTTDSDTGGTILILYNISNRFLIRLEGTILDMKSGDLTAKI